MSHTFYDLFSTSQWSEESVTTTTWTSRLFTPASVCGTASSSSWEGSSMSACSWSSSKGISHAVTLFSWTPFNCFHVGKIQFIEATLAFAFICRCAPFSVEQKNVLNWAVTPASAAKSLALDGKVCFVQQTVFIESRVRSVQQLSSLFPHVQSFRSFLLVPFLAKILLVSL